MERQKNNSTVFNPNTLHYYYSLLVLREFDLLRQSFYYNFDNFVIYFNSSSEAKKSFLNLFINNLMGILPTTSDNFSNTIRTLIEILDLDIIEERGLLEG